ncbi:DNA replication/repair protein RecF [Ruixingdingia sedimenti]|uniref:DNA replication and repair protein RecF n=1 Tax=Ruixingdingia sedimenti TaxID=3073604 RepID=A0ABU1F7P4_9RHOB|nr:DNA replication/repair protein RecF [Xinfangfangia sp. LG-4]MDR5652464.1 DNA replication/repair protein RecF [Xinfangfangia sp. LG-4]
MSGPVILSLALSHFRSWRGLRLALDGRPVAIWGANGAGKTNILEAVSLLSPGRGLRRAGPEAIARRPETLGWKVSALLDGHEVETRAEPGQPRQVRIDGKAAPQAALGRLLRVLWLTPAMDRLWTEGAEERRRFLDRIALSFFPDHAEDALAYEKAMRERNRLLRDGVRDAAWFDALEARMAMAGARIVAHRQAALDRIMAAQRGAATAFPAADLTVEMAEDAGGGEDLAAALAASRRRDMAAGRTLVGPHRADLAALWAEKGMAAALCSTGEQKALLISLILANARALAADTGTAPALLLDEVAAHLDPGRRAALYDEICAMRAQAFMTGTEPALFTPLAGRAQGFEVSGGEGGSVMQEAWR